MDKLSPLLLLLVCSCTLGLSAQDNWERSLVDTGSTASSLNMISVTYGEGRYVAVAYTNTSSLYESTDGYTWTPVNAGNPVGVGFAFPDFIAYYDGAFWLHQNLSLYRSTDLETWTFHAVTGVSLARHFRVENKVHFIGGEGTFAVSEDMLTWTEPLDTPADYLDMAYGNDIYVLVGRSAGNGTLYTSTDGTTWEQQIAVEDGIEALYSVDFHDGDFVVVGNVGTIGRSTDGIDWNWDAIDTPSSLQSVRWMLDYWVTNSTSRIYYSEDAITWTQADGFGSQLKTLVELNGHGFVPGRAATLLTTAPGNPLTGAGFFQGEMVFSDDWPQRTNWFGNYDRTFYPWVLSETMGWIAIVPGNSTSTRDGFWYYQQTSVDAAPGGWYWSSSNGFYPFMWSARFQNWAYLLTTFSEGQAVGQLYIFGEDKWYPVGG